jgi:hypothetical protein
MGSHAAFAASYDQAVTLEKFPRFLASIPRFGSKLQ